MNKSNLLQKINADIFPIDLPLKVKKSFGGKIFTCHDDTVTLTFNLTQLFYFQNISFLFSANKSQHATSNLKYMKRQKVGRGHLILIFRGQFPYEGNQGNVDAHLHTMNAKHQVLNRKIVFFVSLKLNMWKCKNKKSKSYRSSYH